jgi:hypothetical protein
MDNIRIGANGVRKGQTVQAVQHDLFCFAFYCWTYAQIHGKYEIQEIIQHIDDIMAIVRPLRDYGFDIMISWQL